MSLPSDIMPHFNNNGNNNHNKHASGTGSDTMRQGQDSREIADLNGPFFDEETRRFFAQMAVENGHVEWDGEHGVFMSEKDVLKSLHWDRVGPDSPMSQAGVGQELGVEQNLSDVSLQVEPERAPGLDISLQPHSLAQDDGRGREDDASLSDDVFRQFVADDTPQDYGAMSGPIPCGFCNGMTTAHDAHCVIKTSYPANTAALQSTAPVPQPIHHAASERRPRMENINELNTMPHTVNHNFHDLTYRPRPRPQLPFEPTPQALTYQARFPTIAAARDAARPHLTPLNVPNDDWEPTLHLHLHHYAKQLHEALTHSPAPPSTYFSTPHHQNYYTQHQTEALGTLTAKISSNPALADARVLLMLAHILSLHQHGMPTLAYRRTAMKDGVIPDRRLRCSERVQQVIDVVRGDKYAAVDVFEGEDRLADLAMAPEAFLRGKWSICRNNANKARNNAVKEERRAVERAGAAAASSSQGRSKFQFSGRSLLGKRPVQEGVEEGFWKRRR